MDLFLLVQKMQYVWKWREILGWYALTVNLCFALHANIDWKAVGMYSFWWITFKTARVILQLLFSHSHVLLLLNKFNHKMPTCCQWYQTRAFPLLWLQKWNVSWDSLLRSDSTYLQVLVTFILLLLIHVLCVVKKGNGVRKNTGRTQQVLFAPTGYSRLKVSDKTIMVLGRCSFILLYTFCWALLSSIIGLDHDQQQSY